MYGLKQYTDLIRKRTNLFEKNAALSLVARDEEKLGMKLSTDVMQYNHIEWTEFTVGEN